MERHRAREKIRQNERGDMGVGVLIVFISMILVAAVVATVLITTAFEVQQQTECTGNIAIIDVSTGFKVININADRYNPADDWNGRRNIIEILEIKVALFAGSSNINISDVIIDVVSNPVDTTFTFVDTDQTSEYNESATANQFTVEPIRDLSPFNESTTYSMMTPGDLAIFYIDANASGLALRTMHPFLIKILPKHGVSTDISLITPPVYGNRIMSLT